MAGSTLAPEVQALIAMQIALLLQLKAKGVLSAEDLPEIVQAAPDHISTENLTRAAFEVFETIYDRVKA